LTSDTDQQFLDRHVFFGPNTIPFQMTTGCIVYIRSVLLILTHLSMEFLRSLVRL